MQAVGPVVVGFTACDDFAIIGNSAPAPEAKVVLPDLVPDRRSRRSCRVDR